MSQEKKERQPAGAVKSPALEGSKKAAPGTALDEEGTWVMGKFSRVQPVLRLKTPGSGKKKRKRSRPDSSDDSDLDDNDLEKVGRKLAARALGTDPSPRTVQKRPQEDAKKTPEDTGDRTRKRTKSKDEGKSLTAMQKSHQAYGKVLKKKMAEENLITKALREDEGKSLTAMQKSHQAYGKVLKKKMAEENLITKALREDEGKSLTAMQKSHQAYGKVLKKKMAEENLITKALREDEGKSLTAMQKSHQAYGKVLKKKMAEENLITKALREGNESNKRIKFADSDDEEMPSEVKPAKMSLFSSDSDADSDSGSDVDFSLRPQFEGSKGKKLFEIQSRIMDKRFHFDERFKTDSEGEGEEEGESNVVEQDSDDDMAGEREMQLKILTKILGYKPRQRKKQVYVPMSKRRYNPDTAAEFTIVSKAKSEKKAMKKRKSDHDTAAEATVVSKAKPEKRQQIENETEEEVEASTSKLKGLFGGGTNFTFFGSPDDEDDVDEPVTFSHVEKDEEEDEEEAAEEDEEKDAEEDEEEDAEEVEEDDAEVDAEEDAEVDAEEDAEVDAHEKDEERGSEDTVCAVNRARVPEAVSLRPPVHQQRWFMVANDDPRLMAALKFFQRPPEEEFEELKERWADERQRIMELVKERHKRALRKQRMMKFKKKSYNKA